MNSIHEETPKLTLISRTLAGSAESSVVESSDDLLENCPALLSAPVRLRGVRVGAAALGEGSGKVRTALRPAISLNHTLSLSLPPCVCLYMCVKKEVLKQCEEINHVLLLTVYIMIMIIHISI